jgi:hypothetical protein
VVKMCSTGESKYTAKCICLVLVVLTGVITGLVVTVSLVGGANPTVEINGENDSSFIRESNGIHLLEVNTSGQGSDSPGTWSNMELGFVGMIFVFLVNISHMVHYCLITKRLVRKRVQKERSIELAKLAIVPPTDAVVVPALV